jgi:hypothetical protein
MRRVHRAGPGFASVVAFVFFVLGFQFRSRQDLVLRSFSLLALHRSAPVIFSSLAKIMLRPSDFPTVFFRTAHRVSVVLCRHMIF